MQVQLLHVHRFFHKHHDYANNIQKKLSKLLAKRMGSRKR